MWRQYIEIRNIHISTLNHLIFQIYFILSNISEKYLWFLEIYIWFWQRFNIFGRHVCLRFSLAKAIVPGVPVFLISIQTCIDRVFLRNHDGFCSHFRRKVLFNAFYYEKGNNKTWCEIFVVCTFFNPWKTLKTSDACQATEIAWPSWMKWKWIPASRTCHARNIESFVWCCGIHMSRIRFLYVWL